MPRKPWQNVGHVGFHDELVVIGVEELRDLTGVLAFVDSLVWESDRESLHLTGGLLRHCGDDSARVDTSGEERSERNVAAEPQARRVEQICPYELTRVCVRQMNLIGVRELPVTPLL